MCLHFCFSCLWWQTNQPQTEWLKATAIFAVIFQSCGLTRRFFFWSGLWSLLSVCTSLVAQRVNRLSTMLETWVRSLSREDPLEKEMAIHSSTLAWKVPWTKEPGGLWSMGSQSQTRLSNFTFCLSVCSQSCPVLCDPRGCSPPGCSVHGIFQARIQKWAAISSSRGSSWPQGSNLHLLHLLHWQADSLTTAPPEKAYGLSGDCSQMVAESGGPTGIEPPLHGASPNVPSF